MNKDGTILKSLKKAVVNSNDSAFHCCQQANVSNYQRHGLNGNSNAHIVKMGSKFSHAGGHPLNVIKKLVWNIIVVDCKMAFKMHIKCWEINVNPYQANVPIPHLLKIS